DENVGGLQYGIAKEAVGAKVLFLDVFALLLVGGDALQPAQRGDHGEQQVEFGVLRHVRLDEHNAAIRGEACGQPVEHHFQRVLLDAAGIGIVGGERVPISDEE